MSDNRTGDAATIEQDIRATQDQIGETVAKLEEQLTPGKIARSVVGDDGNEIATEALEITRRNPVPVALIAVGLIWLLATGRTRNGTRLVDRIAGALKTRGGAPARGQSTFRSPPTAGGAEHAFDGPLDVAVAPMPAGASSVLV
jgi:hypothetical protein